MKTDAEFNSTSQFNPNPAARAAAREAADRAMMVLIAGAIDAKRSWGARRWFNALSAELAQLGHEPISRSRYMKLFSAERARRKAERIETGLRVAASVGAAYGCFLRPFTPGIPRFGRRDVERVIFSVISVPSQSIGDAQQDLSHSAYLGGERSIRREAFEAILYAPLVIDVVPREHMPDWWRRKVARLRAVAARR